MITVNNLSVRFGSTPLFKDVNLRFTDGNCYGLIGANGAGKSTFLRVLSGELEPDTGSVMIRKGMNMFMLRQDHYIYNNETPLRVVLLGKKILVDIMDEKEALYAKADFSEADGLRAGELEAMFAEMDGWDAEAYAAILLNGLGVKEEYHHSLMAELSESDKVKVLLAQALFADPDILLLDEPSNGLDVRANNWLENFLINYDKTVIVVSHDRHFLDKVCTHIADVDYGSIKIYPGNYEFWRKSTELIAKQLKDSNRKKEDKIKELEDFIARFSANASKSKQATSRKKTLEKITLDDIEPSTRKYPAIDFKPLRESGKVIAALDVKECLLKGKEVLKNIDIKIKRGDKIALVGDAVMISILLRCFANDIPFTGEINFGQTIRHSYFPSDNSSYFNKDLTILEWLAQFTTENDPRVLRGFLGRMLFSGEDALKQVKVLSGGERVRCMLSKCMIEHPNCLFMDDPTNHLDLEAISSLNDALIKFKGELVFVSHDHQFIQTIANRIIEVTSEGIYDRRCTYDEYLTARFGLES